MHFIFFVNLFFATRFFFFHIYALIIHSWVFISDLVEVSTHLCVTNGLWLNNEWDLFPLLGQDSMCFSYICLSMLFVCFFLENFLQILISMSIIISSMNCIFHYVVVFTMLLKANWWPLAGWVLQGLLGPMGLMSANPLEQQAAISSLSTLMSITPRDTYTEFEKVCFLH